MKKEKYPQFHKDVEFLKGCEWVEQYKPYPNQHDKS